MEVQAGTFNPADFSWQGLTMTPAAAAHIRDLMRKQPDKKGLRLGIKTSGCAGFGYVLEMIAEQAPDDLLWFWQQTMAASKIWQDQRSYCPARHF